MWRGPDGCGQQHETSPKVSVATNRDPDGENSWALNLESGEEKGENDPP